MMALICVLSIIPLAQSTSHASGPLLHAVGTTPSGKKLPANNDFLKFETAMVPSAALWWSHYHGSSSDRFETEVQQHQSMSERPPAASSSLGYFTNINPFLVLSAKVPTKLEHKSKVVSSLAVSPGTDTGLQANGAGRQAQGQRIKSKREGMTANFMQVAATVDNPPNSLTNARDKKLSLVPIVSKINSSSRGVAAHSTRGKVPDSLKNEQQGWAEQLQGKGIFLSMTLSDH